MPVHHREKEKTESRDLGARVAGAAKWSALTQIASKLIGPATTMILARLLAPSVFGVVATANMITSLADLISGAGFQSYLVQHRFDDEGELSLSSNVAFWTNLIISLLAVLLVTLLRDSLADIVGSAGWGTLLAVASLSLPLTSLSSVQTALFQRRYDFKTLFAARVCSSLLILLVSVPLAATGFGPWSMVAGTLSSNLFLAIWLTWSSPWKPGLHYSLRELREMFSYGMWIVAESVATWLNMWAGTFIIGRLMDQTHVGYYKTSTSMASSIITLITGAVLPVVFVALSEVQADHERFKRVFLKMQAYLGLGVIPLALGVLVYHNAATLLLLGDQWIETALFFGLWTGMSCLVVVLGHMCSEAYRAIGKPKLCTIVQVLYLVPFLPALWMSAEAGFDTVTWVMPLTRLTLPTIQVVVLWHYLRISLFEMLGNLRWVFIASIAAMTPGLIVTPLTDSLALSLVTAALSVLIYIAFLFSQPSLKKMTSTLLSRVGLTHILPITGSEG